MLINRHMKLGFKLHNVQSGLFGRPGLSYLAGLGTKCSGAQLSGASGKALQACSNLVRRWLRVPILVMKSSYSINTEPRLVIARVPVDELVAVGRVQARLSKGQPVSRTS